MKTLTTEYTESTEGDRWVRSLNPMPSSVPSVLSVVHPQGIAK